MTAPTLEQLRILVARSGRGLTPAEQDRLREGLEALEQARRTAGGLQAEIRRLRGQSAAVSPVDASEAPTPRRSAAGASGGDVAGFNGGAGASSRAGDSRSDRRKAEAGFGGGSRGLAAPGGPVPASSPHAPATATTTPHA